jgi:hypothetical protein
MPKGKSFDDIVADIERLIRVWTAKPELTLAGLTREDVVAKLAGFKTKRAGVEDLRTQLTAGVNDINQEATELVDIGNRGRSAARGQFGPDSTEYEQLGGTRSSERKPPKRKGGAGTPKT